MFRCAPIVLVWVLVILQLHISIPGALCAELEINFKILAKRTGNIKYFLNIFLCLSDFDFAG